jgi:hypothetical protein
MIEADSFEQVYGLRVRQMIADEDRAAFDDLTARVFRGESGVLEFRITGLKGTRAGLNRTPRRSTTTTDASPLCSPSRAM